ncbi:MAG: prepilin-type N-terminal cleavage/methylation domain-containing protein [Verrucomicrobiia bacterium]
MKFETPTNKRRRSAFTLIEVLAALLLLAIVIPVALEALHTASLAGDVAARKGEAARVADEVLNQSLIATNWNLGTQTGTLNDGGREFDWTLSSRSWPVDSAMQWLTAQVRFSVLGRNYSVQLSTLAQSQTLNPTMSLPQ